MLSIIIPFVGEYPQAIFTIQSVAQHLLGNNIDFEIVAVDNWCDQAREQAAYAAAKQLRRIESKYDQAVKYKLENAHSEEAQKEVEKMLPTEEDMYEVSRAVPSTFDNRSGAAIKACSRGNSWLKYVQYEDKLSHWNAKRVGVDASVGDTLLFLDAHVVVGGLPTGDSGFNRNNGIIGMYRTYSAGWNPMENMPWRKCGTFHLPLTYKILEWHKLIYKFVLDNEYFYSYSFTGMPQHHRGPFEVPCMSTCGMMISKEIYDQMGGWPKGLGIYGGGENFMNYTLSVLGYKKFIYPDGVCFHHGDKRDYHYVYDDFVTNRLIAHYLFGGEELCMNLCTVLKGRPEVLESFAKKAILDHYDQRQHIKKTQKMLIQEWAMGPLK